MTKDIYYEIHNHIDSFWPENLKTAFTWNLGKVSELKEVLPYFQVIRIDPIDENQTWIYVTSGAWEVETGEKYRSEFFIISPLEDSIHVETLTMLVYFHATSRRLKIGDSVDIGRSWFKNSELRNLLVSLPYPYGPSLENCNVNNGMLIKFLWLLPITDKEHCFLSHEGLEALEQKFDEANIDFLNPDRDSVI